MEIKKEIKEEKEVKERMDRKLAVGLLRSFINQNTEEMFDRNLYYEALSVLEDITLGKP